MRTLVTGAAGFIGSHLVEQLLEQGDEVRGVDCFTPYYEPGRKHAHLTTALNHGRFELTTADLARDPLRHLLDGVDVVFHLAGQPGVRASWGGAFADYTTNNVLATQRLLEAASHSAVRRFVLASSSSVYGDQHSWPTDEDAPTRPSSPYGISKLAAEHLCRVYAENGLVATATLRYFTVYGPRQRPDMALHRMLESVRSAQPFPLFGSGRQIRDLTYVGDVVAATLAAGRLPVPPGTALNIAGGTAVSLDDMVAAVGEVVGRPVPVLRTGAQLGDVCRTAGATARARIQLEWAPQVALHDGIRAQARWQLGALRP